MMKNTLAEIPLDLSEKKMPSALMLLIGVASILFAILFMILGYAFGVAGVVWAYKRRYTHKTGLVMAFSIIGLILSLLNTVLTLLVTM